jgi:cobalt-zinc-cadmium efflux system outer membrane protein
MKFGKTILLCIAISLHGAYSVRAQDTVKINIGQAEKLFLEKNLQLLAESCSVDIARAGVMQAKLFNNPELSASTNIYNPDYGKWFGAGGKMGHYTLAIEQVIRIGGRRNREIAMMKSDVRLSENRFYDLLRTLRFSLNSAFYEAYYTLRSLESFDLQIAMLQDLQAAYGGLKGSGIVTSGEHARIQLLLYGLQSDRLELQEKFNGLQSQLQILLQDNRRVFIPEADGSEFAFRSPESLVPDSLISEAIENRIDMKIAREELEHQQRKVSLEKANVIPDLTLGVDYDKRGGYAKDLFSVSLSVPIPVFNRNSGNIRAARAAAAQKEMLAGIKQSEIENEVMKAYANAMEAGRASRSIDADFEQNMQSLLKSITDNFRKRNVGMLEFTDFYESYRDNTVKINQLKNRRTQTMEELRFAVGTDF